MARPRWLRQMRQPANGHDAAAENQRQTLIGHQKGREGLRVAPAILVFHIHHTVISRGRALRSFLFSLIPSLGLSFAVFGHSPSFRIFCCPGLRVRRQSTVEGSRRLEGTDTNIRMIHLAHLSSSLVEFPVWGGREDSVGRCPPSRSGPTSGLPAPVILRF